MGSMVSGLADAVLGVVEGVGLSSDTVARYGKCCEVVVEFCDRRDFDALPAGVVDEFVACQQERARRGEIGRNRRNALVKTARMMLELQRTGEVAWRVMSPGSGLSESSCEVLEQFAAAAGLDVAPGSVRLLAGEIRHFLEGIETETPCGKRDYAMVLLAVSTGLRCCDIVALRLDEIDWRRDEIRLVQAKTSKPLALPLPALAGNAVAEWILHGRPDCDAPEVFVRLKAPFVGLGNSTGSTLMRRRLTRAGIDHAAGDGKSFHALRRTAGTRLIESGAGLPLAAQVLGHARIDSSRRYFALASEQIRQCCLPLEEFTCIKEGLR